MKNTLRCLSCALIIVLATAALPSRARAGETMKLTGSISGVALGVIQTAIPKAIENGLDLKLYSVSVYDQASSYLVIFDDPKAPAGQRGSGALVGYEVEVSKPDLRIIRANFIR